MAPRPWLFPLTAFVSAFLLFSAQPMVARMALPRLGGSPGVWIGCQLFFQALLLAGYWYAHVSSSALPPRFHARLHAGLLLGGFVLLPLGLPSAWTAAAGAAPVLSLLGGLAAHGGLPLLAVGASAPLLQRWLAWSGRDPYPLYAASNLGSFAALACYPLLLEPAVRLSDQGRLWSWGYGLFALLTMACMVSTPAPAVSVAAPAPPAPWGRRLRWLALAFAPASMSLGATSYLTTNVAPIPLFWALPLGIYLASYVFAFGRRPASAVGAAAWVAPALLLLTLRTFALPADAPLAPAFALHLAALAGVAVVLHCRLADERPDESGLTEYYLWLAGGGALAGLFNAVAAPLLLKGPLEYPASLCIAALLLPAAASGRRAWSWAAAAAAGALALSPAAGRLALDGFDVAGLLLVYAATTLRLDLRPGLAALCLCAGWAAHTASDDFLRERSFFGSVRVADIVSQDGERLRHLQHGNTTHGYQSFDRPEEPLTYYHRGSGVGKIILSMCARGGCPRTAVVGLGAGTLAAYAGKGFQLDFYEIDPMIVRLAERTGTFTYIANARLRGAKVRVILGDGRLRLAEAADGRYALVVVDAFGSDSIPTHLMTRQALELYMRKLGPGGVAAIHVSNRYLQLAPVVADIARELGLAGRVHSSPSPEQAMSASVWVALARSPKDLAAFTAKDGWTPLTGVPGRPAWDDERLDLLSAVTW